MDLTLPHMPCAVRSSTTIFLFQSRSLCLLPNIRSPSALSPPHRPSSSLRSPLFRDRILINAASLMQPLFRNLGNPNPRLQMSARKPAEDVTRADSAHPETSTTKLLFQSSSRVDKGRLSERQSSPKREQFSRGPKIFHGRSDPRSDSKTRYTSRAPNHHPALGNGRRAGSTLDKEAQYARISSGQRGSNLAQSRMSGTIPGPSSCARGEPSQSQNRIYVIQGLKQQVEQKDSRAKVQVTIEEPQKQRRRKGDGPTPEKQIRWELGMCSRYADLPRALSVFDRVTNEAVIKLTPHDYNVLLYICSSAAMGVLKPTGQGGVSESAQSVGLSTSEQTGKLMENPMSTTRLQAHEECRSSDAVENGVASEDRAASSGDQEFVVTKELMDLGLKRGFEIYEHMLKEGVTVNEATFTSVARLAVAKGDGDLAFDMVKKMAATNITPRLRSYVPALSIYCKNKQVHQAFEVYAHMLVAGILPEESELATLLKASVEAGLEDKVYSLLHRLRTTARELSPSTVQTIEEWFTSEAAAAAGERERGKPVTKEDLEVAIEAGGGGWHGLGWIGKGNWKVERGNIDKKGVCKCCGEQLCTIDLDPQETENFSVSLAKLACEREAFSNEFKHFQGWLDKRGPFDAIVDGANVGLYQQNFAEGGFSFQQLNAVVRAVQRISQNGKSPLVLLHCNRTKGGAASSPRAQDLLQRWFRENTLYATPIGSNDDWYWLYAAVKYKCLLVTNDEMRDHLFQLLGTDFFPKWKERHQVRFSFNKATVELHMPPPYSIVIQESKDGSWHIPQSGGDDINTLREWLCVSRCLDVDLGDTSSESQLNLQTWASLPVETDSMENIVSHEQSEKLCGPPSELGKRQKRVSSRSTSPRKLRRELQAIPGSLSPPASPTLLKLEAAEKHLSSPIDFQI